MLFYIITVNASTVIRYILYGTTPDSLFNFCEVCGGWSGSQGEQIEFANSIIALGCSFPTTRR
jgi:hypothetical protein